MLEGLIGDWREATAAFSFVLRCHFVDVRALPVGLRRRAQAASFARHGAARSSPIRQWLRPVFNSSLGAKRSNPRSHRPTIVAIASWLHSARRFSVIEKRSLQRRPSGLIVRSLPG